MAIPFAVAVSRVVESPLLGMGAMSQGLRMSDEPSKEEAEHRAREVARRMLTTLKKPAAIQNIVRRLPDQVGFRSVV